MDNLDKEVVIHVRSPSLNETLVVKITLNATILSLKQSIERIHPQHPSSNNQRIIYSGKLLEDTETLINILKKVNEEAVPIFHLVVKPSLQTIGKSQLAQSQVQASVPPRQPQQPSSSFTASNPVPPTFEPLQQEQHHHVPAYPPVLPGGYQVVMIHGQYYLAPVLVPSHPLPVQTQQGHFFQPEYHTQSTNQSNQHPEPQPQQAQREPIIQPFINQLPQQQQQQPFGLNGIARPAIAQRATSIWLALKLVVVLFMVCQGASIERIFLFHAIAFVFFFYQTGRLRFVLRRVRVEDLNRFRPGQQPHPQAQAANNNNNNVPGAANSNAEGASTSVNNNNDNNLNQRRQTHGEAPSSSSEANASTNETPVRPLTAMEVWKRGAYAFVASLWPTYGVDPRIAQAFENDNNQQRDGAEEF